MLLLVFHSPESNHLRSQLKNKEIVETARVGKPEVQSIAVVLTREDESVNGNIDCLSVSVLPTNLHIWYQFY